MELSRQPQDQALDTAPSAQPRKPAQSHPARRAIFLVMAALGLMLLAPHTARLVLILAGGHALNAAVAGEAGAVASAIAYFERAASLGGPDATLNRHLARAYTLGGDYQAAAKRLEQAQQLLPDSQLVAIELADAYARAGELDATAAVLQRLGLNLQSLLAYGDAALVAGNPAAALSLYQQATSFAASPDSAPILFRRAVAAAMAGDSSASTEFDQAQLALPSLTLFPAGARIQGRDLHWLQAQANAVPVGSQLGATYSSPEGYFWWSGEAVAFLEVATAGQYTVRAEVRHESPAPVQMALGVGGHTPVAVSLERGDGSTEVISTRALLGPGIHVVRVWFFNNGTVAGDDRDAVVTWVEVVPTK